MPIPSSSTSSSPSSETVGVEGSEEYFSEVDFEYREDDFALYDTLSDTDDNSLSAEEDEEEYSKPVLGELEVNPDEVTQVDMTRGIEKDQRRLLQRGLRSLKDIAFLRSRVDGGFIRHSRLKWGLQRLQTSMKEKKSDVFRRRSANQTVLKRWKQLLSEEKPVDASYVRRITGIQVWAAYKWIAKSIEGQSYPTTHFQGHPSVALRRRRRWYIEGKIRTSQHRIPLYLHALAKLDVYQLTHTFRSWKIWVQRVVKFTKCGREDRMRKALIFWFRSTIKKLRCKRAEYLLVYSKQGTLLINSFAAWKTMYMGQHRYRASVLPRAYRCCLQLLKRNQRFSRLSKVRNSRSMVYFKLKMYKKVLHMLKRQAGRSKRMESNYYAVRYLENRNVKAKLFVIWCVRTAKEIKSKRYINYIINRRFKNQLWLAFFAWRNMWERCVFIRDSAKERLALYSIQMKHRIRTIEGKCTRAKKVKILREWAMMVRSKNVCEKIWFILCSRYRRYYTFWALRKWYLITNLGIVVTCMQKHWRGYHCRHLSIMKRSKGRKTKAGGIALPPGQLYRYIRWYRGQIPRYLRFLYTAMKRRVLHTWYNRAQESMDKLKRILRRQNIRRFFDYMQRYMRRRNKYYYHIVATSEYSVHGKFGLQYRCRRVLRKLKENAYMGVSRALVVSYAKKHHIKSLKYAGLERMNLKRNLHGVRNRLVAGHHMRSFMLPSLRKLRRMTAARAYCNRQFQYSSRFSTLTRVLSVYKRMSYQSHMKKMYMSLRNTAHYHRNRYVCSAAIEILFSQKVRSLRRKQMFINTASQSTVAVWLKKCVVVSKMVGLMRMKRVLRRLYWLCQDRKSKQNFIHKQRHYYLLKGLNGLDRNVYFKRENLRTHRRTAKMMNLYRKKESFRRVFWLPYMQHGLKALSNGTTKRVMLVLQFWCSYIQFLVYARGPANERALRHFKSWGRRRGFRLWLHNHRDRMKRKRINTARLDLWNGTLLSYYFRDLYRIIAIRRRFRMISCRFKIGKFMDIWAYLTGKELHYRYCIVENERRRLYRTSVKAIAAWRLFTKQQLYYQAQTEIIRSQQDVQLRRRYMALWLRRMWQKEEALLYQKVYKQTCLRDKHKAIFAWSRSFKSSQKAKRNKCRAIFNILHEYKTERQHKRFEREVRGPTHFNRHLYQIAVLTLKWRHSQFQLSNSHGKQAYMTMLQYLMKTYSKKWKARVATTRLGCSVLYMFFRTIFPRSLVEFVINTEMESNLRNVRTKSEGSSVTPSAPAPQLHSSSLSPPLSQSLEQLFVQTQTSIKRLRAHAKSAGGKLKVKADQDVTQYYYQILSHPTRKMRNVSDVAVSTLLRCRRLVKWWKIYTDDLSLRRRMKTKKNCLQAWRREVIRYRTQLNHLLRVLQVSGVKCRYNIFFRVMKKRYVAFKKAAQLEVEVQLRSQGAWLRHWRRQYCVLHACQIAQRVASQVQLQTSERIIKHAFSHMKVVAVIQYRLRNPIILGRAWERLCNRRRAMKHYEMVSKRTMISHLHTLCKGRRKKRYMLKALHSLQLPLDIWFRRVEYYEIKRIFYEWKHRTFEDVDDNAGSVGGRKSRTFSPVSSYTKVYFRPHAHDDDDDRDGYTPEFKDSWRARMNEFKHLYKYSALGGDKLTVASLATRDNDYNRSRDGTILR